MERVNCHTRSDGRKKRAQRTAPYPARAPLLGSAVDHHTVVVIASTTVPLLELFYAFPHLPSLPLPPPCAALLFKNRTFRSRAKKGGSQGHCSQRGRGLS